MQSMNGADGRVYAVLGPTNTGKTQFAIERMLTYSSGMIGLPLRLLAREVYDKVKRMKGRASVALVTGEERIVPDQALYWVCTVEAMPTGSIVDFLAVDEIQLCGDPERGHVFTDRLLNSRGKLETHFLGAETMRDVIADLVPDAIFQRRARLSNLTYTGAKKISRMKARTAIVGFSVEDIYAIAEHVRRQRGGAAVVMGALSPRTRNAQVEIFQSGEVDFLVATDAIGMGLNLDISHVAFSSLAKFDGSKIRRLAANELAQIAGRAGRYMRPGTFGVTGDAEPIDSNAASAIMENRFAPLRRLQWRNSDLDFSSAASLIDSLSASSRHPLLVRARNAADVLALCEIAHSIDVRSRLRASKDVELLWDVCQLPDFRKISIFDHSELLKQVFTFIQDRGFIPDDWLDEQVGRIDRIDGDVDALSMRIAFVRTWTYVAQRQNWVEDCNHWRERTRDLEDRLSDALHAGLTRRFIDRRTTVLLGRLKRKEDFVPDINDKGEVTVDGQFIGRLEGFRFRQDSGSTPEETKVLRQTAVAALGPELSLRSSRLYSSPNSEFDFSSDGTITWNDHVVGRASAGPSLFVLNVEALVSEEAAPVVRERVERRLSAFIEQTIEATCGPLLSMSADEEMSGQARGFTYQLVEALGVIKRSEVREEVKALDQDQRRSLRKHGVRFGQYCIFIPSLLKPLATRIRWLLRSLSTGTTSDSFAPQTGLVTIPCAPNASLSDCLLSGYYPLGERALRVDMLERLADMLREKDAVQGFEASSDMLSITGLSQEGFASVMRSLGYVSERGERDRVKLPAASPDSAISAGAEPGERDIEIKGERDSGQSTNGTPVSEQLASEDSSSGTEGKIEPSAEVSVESRASAADSDEDSETEDGEPPQSVACEMPPEKDWKACKPEKVIFYTFTRKPKRRPNPGQQRRARPAERENANETRRSEKDADGQAPKEFKRRDKAKRDNRIDGAKTMDNRPAGVGKRRLRQKKSNVSDPKRIAPHAKQKRAVNPDSPFAVLLELKDRL